MDWQERLILVAVLALGVTLPVAHGVAAQSPDRPSDISMSWNMWNFNSVKTDGHTGKMLVLPQEQVHYGPGRTGLATAVAHLHWRDPETGALDGKGVPLDPNWAALPGYPCPKVDPNFAYPATPTEDLMKQWTLPLDADTVTALLRQNWREVQASLLRQDEAILSPIARAVLGHSFLATNECNRAATLLSSIAPTVEKLGWQEWTADLAKKHGDAPLAVYLYGDALARQGDMGAAISQFDRSLRENPAFFLALNARGLARLAQGDLSGAEEDFLKATESARFVDGYLSLGNYHLVRREPDGALQAFDKALTLDNVAFLATNGKGCALYNKGDWDGALSLFKQTLAVYPSKQTLANLSFVTGAAELVKAETVSKGEAAMTLGGLATTKDWVGMKFNEVRLSSARNDLDYARTFPDGFDMKFKLEGPAVGVSTTGFSVDPKVGIEMKLPRMSEVGTQMRVDSALSDLTASRGRLQSQFSALGDAQRRGDVVGGAAIKKAMLSSDVVPQNGFTLGYELPLKRQ